MPRRLLLLPFFWLLGYLVTSISFAQAAEDSKPVFRAGAYAANITPQLGEMIVGNWEPIPATHIHDELHARCIVLDDGKTKLAIVVCDNVGIPREVHDAAKKLIAAETGIPTSHVLISATHTHSATTARGPYYVIPNEEPTFYQTFLARRIADGVRCAINQLEPAKIGWGSVQEPTEVFNRRWFVKDGALLSNPFGGIDQVRMNPPKGSAALDRPAGPVDPEVSFISIQSIDGRPIALLANYSLHYVGGVPNGDVSADYFGYFAKFIGQKLGAADQTPAFVGVLSNGTSGDVNNINFAEKGGKSYGRYEKMQEVADKLATKVAAANAKLEFKEDVTLDAAISELTLTVRKPTPEIVQHFAEVRARVKAGGKQDHARELIYADRADFLMQCPETLDVPLQVLRIGGLAITAIPFEAFTETGLELKARTPFAKSFTIELANGSFGYLPTPEQHRLGGYETWLGTNTVEMEASLKITAELLKLENSLLPAK